MKVYSLDQLNQVREAHRLGEGGGLEHIKDHELEHIKDHDIKTSTKTERQPG